jgi:hypothetical protein
VVTTDDISAYPPTFTPFRLSKPSEARPGDAPSIETMLNGLREEGHLSDELYERAKNLGWWTYYAEWGTGQRLDDSEMPGFLAGAPLTLLELTRSCLSARTE